VFATELDGYIPDPVSQESEIDEIALVIEKGRESQSTVACTGSTSTKKSSEWKLLELDPNAVKLWPLGSFSFVDFMQSKTDVAKRIKFELKKEPSPQEANMIMDHLEDVTEVSPSKSVGSLSLGTQFQKYTQQKKFNKKSLGYYGHSSRFKTEEQPAELISKIAFNAGVIFRPLSSKVPA
jgi:hypothetical protein